MVQNTTNGTLVPVKFDQIQEEVPDLNRLGYNLQVVTFNPPIDSSNMTPAIWVKIANTIERNYSKYDGFVILHGTDTMAYTASALSYMFENLDKPIVLTGSQLPIGILRTDGKENLITSIQIAAAKKNGMAIVPEVCVYFNSRLFRGNRISKRHADDFSAFSSANYPPLANAGVEIKYSHENIQRFPNKGILKVRTHFDENGVRKHTQHSQSEGCSFGIVRSRKYPHLTLDDQPDKKCNQTKNHIPEYYSMSGRCGKNGTIRNQR